MINSGVSPHVGRRGHLLRGGLRLRPRRHVGVVQPQGVDERPMIRSQLRIL